MEYRAALYMIVATWARATGLTQDEASGLWNRLATQQIPDSVDEAYELLEHATQHIRHSRNIEDW
jgi:hypothetical protein